MYEASKYKLIIITHRGSAFKAYFEKYDEAVKSLKLVEASIQNKTTFSYSSDIYPGYHPFVLNGMYISYAFIELKEE